MIAATTARSTRSPSASSADTRSAPPAAASARRTPTRSTAIGIRIADLFDESILRQKVEGVLDLKNHLLTKVYNRRAIDGRRRSSRSCCRTSTGCGRWSRDTSLLLNQALDRGETVLFEGAQATHARRRPRHLPVRDLQQPGRRRRLHRRRHRADPDRPGDRRDQGVHDPRRLGPVPDRARSTSDGEHLQQDRRRVSASPPAAPAAAAGTTPSSPATPPGQRRSPTSSSPSSTCSTGLGADPGLRGLRVDGVRHDEMPMTQTEFHHAKPIYEYLDGWQERHLRRPHLRRPARKRAGLRRGARGDVRRPDLGRRRRPGARADDRRPRRLI